MNYVETTPVMSKEEKQHQTVYDQCVKSLYVFSKRSSIYVI